MRPNRVPGKSIDVRGDREGLEIAAGEMLMEAMMAPHRRNIERQMRGASAAQMERALSATRIPRTVAAGYYSWAEHLFHLEGTIASGSKARVQAVELRGLAAIAAARHEFNHAHPPCPGCGLRLLDRGVDSCGACGKKFGRTA